MFVQRSHTFAMFYIHALHEKQVIPVMYMHITLATFIRFAKNSTVEFMLALYGPTTHVATLQPHLD